MSLEADRVNMSQKGLIFLLCDQFGNRIALQTIGMIVK
jgi:hypothetical protein